MSNISRTAGCLSRGASNLFWRMFWYWRQAMHSPPLPSCQLKIQLNLNFWRRVFVPEYIDTYMLWCYGAQPFLIRIVYLLNLTDATHSNEKFRNVKFLSEFIIIGASALPIAHYGWPCVVAHPKTAYSTLWFIAYLAFRCNFMSEKIQNKITHRWN